MQTVPTGLAGVPPVGPAMPEMANAKSDLARRLAFVAIAEATVEDFVDVAGNSIAAMHVERSSDHCAKHRPRVMGRRIDGTVDHDHLQSSSGIPLRSEGANSGVNA